MHAAHEKPRERRQRLGAQQRKNGQAFHVAGLPHLHEGLRLAHMPAHEPADQADHAAEDERQSPRPRRVRLAAEQAFEAE